MIIRAFVPQVQIDKYVQNPIMNYKYGVCDTLKEKEVLKFIRIMFNWTEFVQCVRCTVDVE